MLSEIKKTFYNWCSESDIFDNDQLKIIYNGLVNFSLEKVQIYANDCFDANQMKQIYFGLEILPTAQVMIYANPEFEAGQMWEIRQGLETLPVEDVIKFAKPEISKNSMASYRMNAQGKLFFKLFEMDYTFLVPSQVCEALRAVKNLPFDQAQKVVDFKDSSREMEIKRINAELVYFEQIKDRHEAKKCNCDMNEIFETIDNLSKDELEEIINYINLNLDSDFLENSGLVKTKTI